VNWPKVNTGGFSLTKLAADLKPTEINPWAAVPFFDIVRQGLNAKHPFAFGIDL
jgi:hypothetical protein